ncbi:MAG: hydrogenase maturation nickel metallochaperone HypA [Acidobacteriota bacterium]
MHEFAIAQDIISSLEQQLKEDLKMITSIEIEAGAFAGIVTDSLVFGIEAILAEKKIRDVDVRVDQAEAEALCECGNSYKLKDVFDLCPKCGSAVREMKSGTELSVKSVNIKESEDE